MTAAEDSRYGEKRNKRHQHGFSSYISPQHIGFFLLCGIESTGIIRYSFKLLSFYRKFPDLHGF